MKVKLTCPNYNKLIVKIDIPKEEKSEGGLVLAKIEVGRDEFGQKVERISQPKAEDAAMNDRGTIIQIGPYAWNDLPEVPYQIGDEVIFSKYAGSFVTDKGVDIPNCYRIIRDIDVECKIDLE